MGLLNTSDDRIIDIYGNNVKINVDICLDFLGVPGFSLNSPKLEKVPIVVETVVKISTRSALFLTLK